MQPNLAYDVMHVVYGTLFVIVVFSILTGVCRGCEYIRIYVCLVLSRSKNSGSRA